MEVLLKTLLKKDQESYLVWHQLPPGKAINEHIHEGMDEYVLVRNGKFSIKANNEVTEYDLENEFTVIHFPAGVRHSLLNGDSTTDYFVIRTRK